MVKLLSLIDLHVVMEKKEHNETAAEKSNNERQTKN